MPWRERGGKGTHLLEEIGEEAERLHQQEKRWIGEMVSFVLGEEGLSQNYLLLRTIPGVGPLTAIVLLTLELTYPGTNRQQLVALVGLDPRERRSGSSRMKPKRISQNGDAMARQVLFLASLTAGRLNAPLVLFKERLLAHGKAKKVVYVAIARKLLLLAHATYRAKRPFQDSTGQLVPVDGTGIPDETRVLERVRELDMAYSI